MRLSESLRKNILKAGSGSIINRFKVLSRRDVLFFDDIFIPYIGRCEKSEGEAVQDIGREWMNLYFSRLLPQEAMKIPPAVFFNLMMKKVWISVGLLEDLRAGKEGNVFNIMTKNEKITTHIGKNRFLPSLYAGTLDVLCGSVAEIEECRQTRKMGGWNLYSFRITDRKPVIRGKSKMLYSRLNGLAEKESFGLRQAVKSNVMRIRDGNRVFFRDRQLSVVENTLFHLIGNRGLCIEYVSPLSFRFFKSCVEGESSEEQKLALLKTLLQSMGWGEARIAVEKNRVIVSIFCPPYGLQEGGDNWDFLAHWILGYMRLIGSKPQMSSMVHSSAKLRMTYDL